MSGSFRFIRIAQQPPASVFRGDLFNFIAYFPKSSRYQEVVQAPNSLGDQVGFPTYRNGGFATAEVIHADSRRGPLPSSSSPLLGKGNDGMVIGASRADFNPTNEDDRTIRFELGIKCTGTFTVIVRLHQKHAGPSRVGGNGSETGGNYIVTSVATRQIKVVERQEQNDTRFVHARDGRLTPPPMGGGEEEKEYESSHVDGKKLLRTDTGFNGGRDLSRRARQIIPRPKNVTLPEAENSGSSKRKGKKSQRGVHISTSTPYQQQNARRHYSEPGKDDSWGDNDDGADVGGVNFLGSGRLIMPRPDSTLLETNINDGENWSDDDDSDDEGGVKLIYASPSSPPHPLSKRHISARFQSR